MKFATVLTSFLCLYSGIAQSAYQGSCRDIEWEPGIYYKIKAAPNQRVHVTLPFPIQGKPVKGSKMWDVEAEGTHLFIKPRLNIEKKGKHTTVTAVLTNGLAVDLKVTRTSTKPDNCVVVSFSDSRVNGREQGWTNPQSGNVNARLLDVIDRLSDRNKRANDVDNNRVLDQEILKALHRYRSSVYTRYSWNETGFITDVWDDGRLTFIRLKEDNTGWLQLRGNVQGQDEILQYAYDQRQRLYTIAGLYPKLILKVGNKELEITRSDATNIGSK